MKYDLIVIGAGPGGYIAGIEAGKLNKKVLVIDKNELGGVCLNHGCIPSKIFYQTAKLFQKFQKYSKKDIIKGEINLNLENLIKEKLLVINKLQKGIEYLFKKYHVEFIKGQAQIIDNHSIELLIAGESKIIEGEHILIATGSHEFIPDFLKNFDFFTGETLWDLKIMPESMLIIGGGVIGIEIASIFSALGVKIYLVELKDQILPLLDKDIAQSISKQLEEKNVEIFTSKKIINIEKDNIKFKIKLDNDKEIIVDCITSAIGRRPNSDIISGKSNLNLQTTNGFININKNFQTSEENIYAIGDVVNQGKMFAHYSSYQASFLISYLFEKKTIPDKIEIPFGIFSIPEIAGIGYSEKELAEQKIDFKIKKVSTFATSTGKILNLQNGFLKLLLDQQETILGAHIISENAVDLIHMISQILNNDSKKDLSSLFNTVFIHPSESEIYSHHVLDLT